MWRVANIGSGRRNVRRSLLTLALALSTLVFGLTAGPYFAWAAWRLRSIWLAAEAMVYLALTVLWLVLLSRNPPSNSAQSVVGGLIIIVLSLVACGRAISCGAVSRVLRR
jgi:hypothetical protein